MCSCYWKRAGLQGLLYFLKSYYCIQSLLFTLLICWQVFFHGVFLCLLIWCLVSPWLPMWSHIFCFADSYKFKFCLKNFAFCSFSLLDIVSYSCSPQHFLFAGTVCCWSMVVFCLIAGFCYPEEAERAVLLLFIVFLLSENTCSCHGCSGCGWCSYSSHLNMCWHHPAAGFRVLILPWSLGVKAGHLLPVL